MSTVGVVALSILAAFVLFALLASIALLLWLAFSLKKTLASVEKLISSVHAETEKQLATHQSESKSVVESAKAGFSAIRTEVRGLLEDHRKETRTTSDEYRKELAGILDSHRQEMKAGIDRINADALQGAAARSIQACLKLEKTVTLLQTMMLDTETRSTYEAGAEDFAPEEPKFGTPPSGYGMGQTAMLDMEAEREVQIDMFTDSPAEV